MDFLVVSRYSVFQLEKAREQDRLLEESARELAERQKQQEKLQRQLEEKAVY
jgi:kinesin family protein 3/17